MELMDFNNNNAIKCITVSLDHNVYNVSLGNNISYEICFVFLAVDLGEVEGYLLVQDILFVVPLIEVRLIFLQVLLAYAIHNPKYNVRNTAFKAYSCRVL